MNFFFRASGSEEPHTTREPQLGHFWARYSPFVWMSLIYNVADQVTWCLEYDVAVTWRKLEAMCHVWAVVLRVGSKANVWKVKAGHSERKVNRLNEITIHYTCRARLLSTWTPRSLHLRGFLSHEWKRRRKIEKWCLTGTSTCFLCSMFYVTTWQWRFRKVLIAEYATVAASTLSTAHHAWYVLHQPAHHHKSTIILLSEIVNNAVGGDIE